MNIEEFVEKVFQEIQKQENKVKMYTSLTNPVAPDNAIGRVSRMDAINNKSVTEAALRQAEERLKKLYNVLDRVNDADFGRCARCGKEIIEGRLLIRPESTLCTKCAT